MSKIKSKAAAPAKLKLDYRLDSIPLMAACACILLFSAHWILKPVIDMPPQRDSGCFLYIGQNWLNGLIPYRDMWDHKGPLLYLLNAAGIYMNGRAGVMMLQATLTSAGFFFLFKTLEMYISHLSAILLSVTGVLILFFINQSGNQTEQWSIFFQGLALYAFFKVHKGLKISWWIMIGFLLACSFMLRPNQIALWLAMALSELVFLISKKQSVKTFLLKTAYGVAGFLIPVSVFSFYFLYHDAFDHMIDCMFTYNFIYSGKSHSSFTASIRTGINSIPFLYIIFSCIAFHLILYLVRFKYVSRSQWFLFLFGISWLVLEIVLSTLAGAGHLHYFVQWVLPVLFISGSFLFSLNLLAGKKQELIYCQAGVSLILAGFMFGKVKMAHDEKMQAAADYHVNSDFRERVAQRIVDSTYDTDYVLQWGMVDGINFMAERQSPSKYFYQYALDTKGYTNEKRIKEFLDEVRLKKPKYILDASKMERFPSVIPQFRDSFFRVKPEMKDLLPANIHEFYAYVSDHYRYEDYIGYMLILRRKD